MDTEISSWKSESYGNALKEINNFTENFDIAKSKLKNSYNDLNKIMMDSFVSGTTGTITPL
jgi:hypothetical protein